MRRCGFPHEFRGDFEPVFRSPELPIPDAWAPRGRWSHGPLHTFTDDYRQDFRDLIDKEITRRNK